MSPRDGTAAALVPLSIFSILFFVATLTSLSTLVCTGLRHSI